MGKTVFTVEDDSEMRRITRLLLERVGYTIQEAGSAEEALSEIVNPTSAVALNQGALGVLDLLAT